MGRIRGPSVTKYGTMRASFCLNSPFPSRNERGFFFLSSLKNPQNPKKQISIKMCSFKEGLGGVSRWICLVSSHKGRMEASVEQSEAQRGLMKEEGAGHAEVSTAEERSPAGAVGHRSAGTLPSAAGAEHCLEACPAPASGGKGLHGGGMAGAASRRPAGAGRAPRPPNTGCAAGTSHRACCVEERAGEQSLREGEEGSGSGSALRLSSVGRRQTGAAATPGRPRPRSVTAWARREGSGRGSQAPVWHRSSPLQLPSFPPSTRLAVSPGEPR